MFLSTENKESFTSKVAFFEVGIRLFCILSHAISWSGHVMICVFVIANGVSLYAIGLLLVSCINEFYCLK